MQDLFDIVSSVEIDNRIWDETAHLAWTMDRRGVILPLTDLIIACCALRAGATIISSDEHFGEVSDLAIATALPTP
jgi:predicted nucleic acid-binding protein